MSLVSSNPVLGLERVGPRKSCPWPWPRIFFVSLALSLVPSTPPLFVTETTNVVWNLSQCEMLISRCRLSKKTKEKLCVITRITACTHGAPCSHASIPKTEKQLQAQLKKQVSVKIGHNDEQLAYDHRQKNQNNRKNRRFFCQILQCDNGCDFFCCFDAIIRSQMQYFSEKNVGCDAIFDMMPCDCHP